MGRGRWVGVLSGVVVGVNVVVERGVEGDVGEIVGVGGRGGGGGGGGGGCEG